MLEAEISQDEPRQWRYRIVPAKMTKTLQALGLYSRPATLEGAQIRRILLPAIEHTLEYSPTHNVEHWGSQGWWYHATITEEEWVLLKLKFFT